MKKKRVYKKTGRRPAAGGKKDRPVSVWDQAALWYDALVGMQGSEYQRQLIMPGAFRLLGLKKDSHALDLACGQGVFSRYIHEKGIQVTGLDTSDELVRLANRRSKAGIKFITADAGDPETLDGKKFDGIACLLAIQNIEDIDRVFKNVKRWLKPCGKFVMVLTHPCFRIPRQSHWHWDEEKKLMARKVDLYSSEVSIPILTPPMATSKIYTMTYHRPLQTIFKSMSGAGLLIDSLEEWSSHKVSEPGKRARAENRARKEFPLFMAIRAVPAPGSPDSSG